MHYQPPLLFIAAFLLAAAVAAWRKHSTKLKLELGLELVGALKLGGVPAEADNDKQTPIGIRLVSSRRELC